MASGSSASSTAAMTQPRSSHLTDPSLRPFLSASFDPTTYLNETLPPPNLSSQSRPSQQQQQQHQHQHQQPSSLPDLSNATQNLMSHLSAHASRLSDTLTQITDDILRSGGRLTYEVEVLRGETIGLSEVLTEGLRKDVSKFVPNGLAVEAATHTSDREGSLLDRRRSSASTSAREAVIASRDGQDQPSNPVLSSSISQLRTLSLVRNRLETVVKVFGDAMEWTLPPSEVSVTSSFISVSAPEPGSESNSGEEKGREISQKLRDEIADLLISQPGDDQSSVEAAAKRVEELRDLSRVWKGTSEEKARSKFVDGLAKMVEERQAALSRQAYQRRSHGSSARSPSPRKSTGSPAQGGRPYENGEQNRRQASEGGYGFIENLQRMRNNIYLD
ncbi:MAG: hypothetical protein M1819_001167 [Sarea resinae]|nr:MAG: hypothetical protein M1819_001167 [Sarea resinae]